MKTKNKIEKKISTFNSSFGEKMEREEQKRRALIMKSEKLLWFIAIGLGILSFLLISGHRFIERATEMQTFNERIVPATNLMYDTDSQINGQKKSAQEFRFSDK